MRSPQMFGSKILFWLLAPWLALGVVVFGSMAVAQVSEGKLAPVLIALVLTLICASALLMCIFPKQLGWMLLCITGSIAFGYIWYFCETYFVEGQPLTPTSGRSGTTPWNALRGFLHFGLPCLLATIGGIVVMLRKRREKKAEPADDPNRLGDERQG